MKKLLTNILIIICFSVIAIGFTNAFLSDVEISAGNQTIAGKVDLKIDGAGCSYIRDGVNIGCNGLGTFPATDLTDERFFDFSTLEPGDWGENTISYHVEDNEAFGCLNINVEDGESCGPSGGATGPTDPFPHQSGKCAVPAGFPAENVEKIEWVDADTSKTITADSGCIITAAFAKAATICHPYYENTSDECYTVNGIGTDTVTISENWNTQANGLSTMCVPQCHDISHTEYVVECCPPYDEIIYFYGWKDDGDNIYEPQEGEIELFEPTRADQLNSYEFANPTLGAIPANTTGYLGLAWCAGTMNVDQSTGNITCNGNRQEVCPTSTPINVDLDFYVEQARHNYNFSCQ